MFIIGLPKVKVRQVAALVCLIFQKLKKILINRTNVVCLVLNPRNIFLREIVLFVISPKPTLEVIDSPVIDANSLPYCFSIDVAFCMRTDSVSVCLTSPPPRSEGEIPSCNPSQVETGRGGDILVLVRSFCEE